MLCYGGQREREDDLLSRYGGQREMTICCHDTIDKNLITLLFYVIPTIRYCYFNLHNGERRLEVG